MNGHPDLAALRGPSGATEEREREELLRHVCECSRCRAELTAEDPSRLFALLAVSGPPPGALDRLSAGVARATAGSATPQPRRWTTAWGALAASLALALLLGGILRRSPEVRAPEIAVADSAPAKGAEGLVRAEPATMIELSSPTSAQLLDLTVGDTQLILIFDEALDI